MPHPENHTHPDYDRNFDRILTIIERIAETQEKLTQVQIQQAQNQAAIQKAMERLTTKSAQTEDKLHGIDLMDRHLREHGHHQ